MPANVFLNHSSPSFPGQKYGGLQFCTTVVAVTNSQRVFSLKKFKISKNLKKKKINFIFKHFYIWARVSSFFCCGFKWIKCLKGAGNSMVWCLDCTLQFRTAFSSSQSCLTFLIALLLPVRGGGVSNPTVLYSALCRIAILCNALYCNVLYCNVQHCTPYPEERFLGG